MRLARPIFLALALAGCSDSTLPGPLKSWSAGGPSSYRYDYQVSCFCPQEYVQPVTIEVRDDRVVRVTSRTTGAEVNTAARWPTVDDLIDLVQDAQTRGTPLEVRYDEELKYPVYIKVGTPENDAGAFHTAGNLKPL